jgi:Leucine-rich repeat (LRR) protein
MAQRKISLRPYKGAGSVTNITCGVSNPKVGGSIDLSPFVNLVTFACDSNDITSLTGYEDKEKLETLSFFSNKIVGPLPNISQLKKLRLFNCYRNLLIGSFPSISGLINLETINFYENYTLSGPIPDLTGLTKLKVLSCYRNSLTGSIPASINASSGLETFNCYENQLTGQIPNVSNLSNLKFFRCYSNQLSGSIPDLSNLTSLQIFNCERNQLTDYVGGTISNTIQIVQIQNNSLSSSAVDRFLGALVATNATGRTLYYGGTNSPPSAQGNAYLLTLLSKGWNIILVV